jgi:hypothetical protein
MRLIAFSVCLAISACASQPQAVVSSDNCLTAEPAGWELLPTPPADSATLKGLVKSSLANPPNKVEERWYASGDQLLYCRREDWCISETWSFARTQGQWQVIDQHSWVCVTTHNNSFKPNPLRGSA